MDHRSASTRQPCTPRPWLAPEDADDAAARITAAILLLRTEPLQVAAVLQLLEQAQQRLELAAAA